MSNLREMYIQKASTRENLTDVVTLCLPSVKFEYYVLGFDWNLRKDYSGPSLANEDQDLRWNPLVKFDLDSIDEYTQGRFGKPLERSTHLPK